MLVDWQNDRKVWSAKKLTRTEPFLCRKRRSSQLSTLQSANLHFCNVILVEDRYGYVIDEEFDGVKAMAGYVLILARKRKSDGQTVEERVRKARDILQKSLGDGESLKCKKHSFIVYAKDY